MNRLITISTFLILVLGLVSCNEKKDIEHPSKEITASKDSQLKTKSHPVTTSISDMVIVSKDTLIAALRHDNILRSVDGGVNWTEIETPHSIKDLTIDSRNRVWGLESWRGIHEPGYSRMLYSDDFGISWEFFEFDIRTFSPLFFLSEPRPEVMVMTMDNNIYEYNGNNPKDIASWMKIDSLKKVDPRYIDRNIENGTTYSVDSAKLYEVINGNRSLPIMDLNQISIYDILQDSSVTFITGHRYSSQTRDVESILIQIEPLGTFAEYNVEGKAIYGIKKSGKNTYWAFGLTGIYSIKIK